MNITERNGRYRCQVRRAGFNKCDTFDSKADAKAWGTRIEREISELRAHGVLQPKGVSVGDLIDRHIEEFYPTRKWGRSKSADLARLKKDLGSIPAAKLTEAHVIDYFRGRSASGAGPATLSGPLDYLCGVLRDARSLWHLDVPQAQAEAARATLRRSGFAGKSKERARRVSDGEIDAIIAHFEQQPTQLPYPDIVRMLVATGMRAGELARIEWQDLDESQRTLVIRQRKHPDPTEKARNDQQIPLLDVGRFDPLAIILRQPRTGARIFRFNVRTISSTFPRAMRKVGLRDLHVHDLRHEALSRLFEAGYHIEQVALVSGHRDWKMLKRYTHLRAVDLHRKPLPRVAANDARAKVVPIR